MIQASLKSLRNQFMYPKPPFAHAYLGKYSSCFDSLLVDDDIIIKLPRAASRNDVTCVILGKVLQKRGSKIKSFYRLRCVGSM